MPDNSFSRRNLLKTAGAAAAAAPMAAAQQTRQPVVLPEAEQSLAMPTHPIRILTMIELDPAEVKQIQDGSPVTVEIVYARTREEFRKALPEAEVVYGGVGAADLDFAPKLKWVQAGGAGVEGVDPKFMQSPIVLTNFARTFAPAISETAMGFLLCLTRGITTLYMPQFYKRQMKPIGTVKSPDHIELAGKTMGIVGMGGIGCNIARRAKWGFDMKVIATDAKPMPKPKYVDELHDPSYFYAGPDCCRFRNSHWIRCCK